MQHVPIWGISATSTSIQAAAPLPSLSCHLPGKGPLKPSRLRPPQLPGLDFVWEAPLGMHPQWTHIHPDRVSSVFLLVKWENDTIHPGSLATSVRKRENAEVLATWSPVALGLIRNGCKRSDVTWEWGVWTPRQLPEEGPRGKCKEGSGRRNPWPGDQAGL